MMQYAQPVKANLKYIFPNSAAREEIPHQSGSLNAFVDQRPRISEIQI